MASEALRRHVGAAQGGNMHPAYISQVSRECGLVDRPRQNCWSKFMPSTEYNPEQECHPVHQDPVTLATALLTSPTSPTPTCAAGQQLLVFKVD